MDSHEMPNEDGRVALARLRFRIVRLNQETLTPGAYVLVGARQVWGDQKTTFPAQLEWSTDGVLWQAVPFVNASLVDDEAEPFMVRAEPPCECCKGTRVGPSNSNFAGLPCPVCAK